MTEGPFFAGIDLGSGFVKVVVMTKDAILSSRVIPTSGAFATIVTEGLNAALLDAGLTVKDLEWTTVTGYGNYNLPFDHRKVSPLSAGARGASFFYPNARTVVDIGLQQSSVIKLDAKGHIVDSFISEKCAAGSGWFLRVVARVMRIGLDDLGPFSLRADNPVTITTDCAVFAETEVVSRVAEGNTRENIVAGAHRALAEKIKNLIERIGYEPTLVLIGGTGKDAGFIKRLQEMVGMDVNLPKEPHLAAAIGAVLFHLT